MGPRIFIQAIRLVFDNFPEALRVSIVPYLLLFAGAFSFVLIVSLSGHLGEPNGPAENLVALPIAIASTVVNLWVAVSWHRVILLGEGVTRAMPRFRGTRIAAYFARSLLLGFVVVPLGILALAIATFAETVMFHGAAGPPATAVTAIFFILALSPVVIVFSRLSIVLPAAAIGRPLRWREAWSATKGSSLNMIVLGILVLAGICLVELPVAFPLDVIPVALLVIWQLVASWLIGLTVLAIFSTLYRVYVERHPISGLRNLKQADSDKLT